VDDLFAELKPKIEALAEPLFDASEVFVRKRGGFLPHGAVLEAGGDVRLMMAAPDELDAPVSSAAILPRLHDALRADARDHELAAVAVCEDVTITPAEQKTTKAIKVLVEHRRGLTVALYLPWRRKLLGGHVFGQVTTLPAQPEVRPWGGGAT
jgi:hypothetical protein